jgi:hypothetical protein
LPPRIRDLKDRKLYTIEKPGSCPAKAEHVIDRACVAAIEEHLEIYERRLASSRLAIPLTRRPLRA